MRRNLALAGIAGLLAIAAPTAGLAAVDTAVPISVVCPVPKKTITREDLAEATLNAAGVQTRDVLRLYPDADLKTYGTYAVKMLWEERLLPKDASEDEVEARRQAFDDMRRLRQRLEQRLVKTPDFIEKEAGIVVAGAPAPGGKPWLFDPAKTYVMRCADGKATPRPDRKFETAVERPAVVIRGQLKDLAALGDDRTGADAAKLGLKKEKTKQDDGATKTDRTETFEGVIGIRLSPKTWAAPLHAYAAYSLSEVRTRPAPPLAAGKTVDENDTNAFEYGLSLNEQPIIKGSPFSLAVDGQIAMVQDYVKDSRRGKLALGLTPGVAANFPVCGLGSFNEYDVGITTLRIRCRGRLEAEASHVYEKGTADFKEHGKFLAMGTSLGIDLAAPQGDKAEIISSLTYRYLPVVSGTAPDISRWDATVRYRIWLDSGLGVDLGLTYGKGRESKAYKDENKLEAGLGLIF
jgi:hypothetical protein